MFEKEEMLKIKVTEDDAAAVSAVLIKRLAKAKYADVESMECLIYMASLTAFAAELLTVLSDREAVKEILKENNGDD